ncbi:MBL fold metallo-hydrolase [Catenulispora pinisilvae]|uniref:MBL fold metallo-hydrolase n=1 Tax=Catenulispora pinisilvae TaxID=2705253 RepID=UPI0018927B49|nr:MBL fold metallo-hydrolase [Catenulispora pinisilvae]
MTGTGHYLAASVSPQPLVHRWYAYPHLISPLTAGFNLKHRQLAILESYLADPAFHDEAISNPSRIAGPFLDAQGVPEDKLREFQEQAVRECAPLLRFADDVEEMRALLRAEADGRPLPSLYPRLPESLRGLVELTYDDFGQASYRFFEPLLYRSEQYRCELQRISLRRAPDPAQPFIFNSPLLTDDDRVDVALPFDSPLLDELFQSRWEAVDPAALAERLGLTGSGAERFATLYSTDTPPAPVPKPESGVRMRYLGHAGILLESAQDCVLLDPILGYRDDGHQHLTLVDLPRHIDAIVLSHAHADHVSIETLLQLRHRTDVVVVPGGSAGTVLDPALEAMLRALGFQTVTALGDLQSARIGAACTVTAIPFLGEHADLAIRSKMVPLVEIGGRRFLFATDTVVLEPELHRRIPDLLEGVDAMFIGLECVGAPMSWLYGPLLAARPSRENDRRRRLAGSDAAMADTLARLTGARRVYVYAMGFEPWLRHLTGSVYDADSEQVRQTGLLLEMCAGRGVPAELLHGQGERSW